MYFRNEPTAHYQPINSIPENTVSISEKHGCKKTLNISTSMNTSKMPKLISKHIHSSAISKLSHLSVSSIRPLITYIGSMSTNKWQNTKLLCNHTVLLAAWLLRSKKLNIFHMEHIFTIQINKLYKKPYQFNCKGYGSVSCFTFHC